MERTIAMFAVGLACAIAMSSACAAAGNNAEHQISAGSPLVVAAATEADKKKFSERHTEALQARPGESQRVHR
jgi:hypothetical protein